MALGVGDGSALSVVGSGGVCPEDALLSGSLVALSEDSPSAGSSEPPQASSSNGRISARAKIPMKRRADLISTLLCVFWPALGRRGRILAHGGGLPASAPAAAESMTRPGYPPGVSGSTPPVPGCAPWASRW